MVAKSVVRPCGTLGRTTGIKMSDGSRSGRSLKKQLPIPLMVAGAVTVLNVVTVLNPVPTNSEVPQTYRELNLFADALDLRARIMPRRSTTPRQSGFARGTRFPPRVPEPRERTVARSARDQTSA